MAKWKMNCPFSGKGCKECSIYRGRHYFLCFSKRYRGVIGDRAENIEEAMKNVTFFPSSKDEKKEPKVSMDKWDKTVFGTETVLIVEDDAFWQDFLNWVLYDTGYTIIIAESREAIDIFNRRMDEINLIIADVASAGKGVIRYAKEKKPSVKAILTTGNYSTVSDFHEEGHVAAVLQKPYSSYTLARMVRDVLDGKVISQQDIEATGSAD
jgi:CheY-like chemotaxis protein